MVEFKRPPGAEGAPSAGDAPAYLMQASTNVPDGVGEPIFSTSQWMVIAFGGMAFSLVMMLLGLIFSWRKARRKRLAERAK
jgi:hypothetical protein